MRIVEDRRFKKIAQSRARTPLTHRSNFHNYTVGKPFNDRTVKRYMIRLEVKDPQVYGEIEWISVQIHGQSFMLHQIVSGGKGACEETHASSFERCVVDGGGGV
jgi:tRNA pseudouridine(38-40) synthase